jgi:hypothetical protein
MLWAGCGSNPAEEGCRQDSDCKDGARCEPGTGVCLRFRNPLDAGIPDLPPPVDLSVIDLTQAD